MGDQVVMIEPAPLLSCPLSGHQDPFVRRRDDHSVDTDGLSTSRGPTPKKASPSAES